MLTYVYIGSVGPVENVYVNKTKKYEFFTLWLSINNVGNFCLNMFAECTYKFFIT